MLKKRVSKPREVSRTVQGLHLRVSSHEGKKNNRRGKHKERKSLAYWAGKREERAREELRRRKCPSSLEEIYTGRTTEDLNRNCDGAYKRGPKGSQTNERVPR